MIKNNSQTEGVSTFTRRDFVRDAGIAALGVTALGLNSVTTLDAKAAASAEALRLAQIAQDAVIFGFPVVLQSLYLQRVLSAGLELNRFALDVDLSTPSTKALGPNDDTLYGLAWFDLSSGPQVISVPPSGGRYYCIQLVDMWTNSFAYIGSRATGDRGGAFVLTPPGYTGKLPAGLHEIKAPTKRVLSFPRTYVENEVDLGAARSFQAEWTTGPLSQYPHGRVKPDLTHDLKPLDAFTTIDLSGSDVSLFEKMNALIHEYPPLPVDAAYARTLRPVGVDVSTYHTPNADLAPILAASIKPAIEAIIAKQHSNVSTINGWVVDRDTKPIDHNPLSRAANTVFAPGNHLPQEALYFTLLYPPSSPPNGAHTYTLRFAKGQTPPVRAFWSVILYDEKTLGLVPNPINRYEVASHTPNLVYASDGSLIISVQNARPTEAHVNWLPAPKGAFKLILRTYLPEAPVLNGTWKPPALKQES